MVLQFSPLLTEKPGRMWQDNCGRKRLMSVLPDTADSD
jgi:hypothetical protein